MAKPFTIENFILTARRVHGNKYEYDKVKYINAKTKVIITCPYHGNFSQSPDIHTSRKHGCQKCARIRNDHNLKSTTKEFINKARNVHSNTYNYSKVDYTYAQQKVIIICNYHGDFSQRPHDHLQGQRCPKCANANISRIENQWIDSLNIGQIERNKRIYITDTKYFKPDGYDPTTNTIYEFLGDFWHGNPKTFCLTDTNPVIKKTYKELYESTMRKIQIYKENKYNVIYIWESDFLLQY